MEGFTAHQATKFTGCTPRQLRYWDQIKLVTPSVQGTGGRPGVPRMYSFRDLVALKVVKSLLDGGMSLQRVRRAWDYLNRRAALDRQLGRRGNLVSALEITVRPDLQGRGLSGIMLEAMRGNAAKLGFDNLVAPVRPTAKHRYPHMPIAEYAAWSRADGLPHDPWLRVHVRAGGRIVGVCHRAMVVPGTLAEWRSWTGLPFDTSGPVEVPHALVPVHCDPVHGHAVYVEPAVWVHHRLT